MLTFNYDAFIKNLYNMQMYVINLLNLYKLNLIQSRNNSVYVNV